MSLILFWIILGTIAFIIIAGKFIDKYHWNNGVCPRCGNKWKCKEGMVKGEILCTCEQCHYSLIVDKSVTQNHWR